MRALRNSRSSVTGLAFVLCILTFGLSGAPASAIAPEPLLQPSAAATTPETMPAVADASSSDLVGGLVVEDSSVAPALAPGEEIVERRTENAKTFATSKPGHFVTNVYSSPVHFRDERSQSWREIDTTLDIGTDGRLRPRSTGRKIHLGPNSSDPTLAGIEVEPGVSASFSLQGARSSVATRKSEVATYRDALRDVDVELSPLWNGVKEVLVLHSPQAPDTFVFPLELEGLRASMSGGDVVYRDNQGRVRMHTPRGWMEDSNVDPRRGEGVISNGVSYSLVPLAGGRTALKVSLDRAWLDDPKRVYPVRVDPTDAILTNADDTFVQTCCPTTPYSTSPELKAGTYNGGGDVARSLLHFSGLDAYDGKIINSAALHLWTSHSYSCSARPLAVYRLTSAFTGSTTWNTQPTKNEKIAEVSYAKGYGASCPAGDQGFDITDAMRNWADNTWPINYGIRLQGSESDSYGWKKFASYDNGTPTRRPYVNVNWSEPNSPPQQPSSTWLEPDNDSLWTSAPELQALYYDPDSGDDGQIQFRVYDGPTLVASHDTDFRGPNTLFKWTPTLPDGFYTWKARAFDGASYSTWTSRTFRIDGTSPVKPEFLISRSHGISFPTPKRMITMAWRSSTDAGSGLDGYSWTVNNSQTVPADTTKDSASTSVTTSSLGDGTWWFHVRSLDNAGNASADVARGPYVINGQAVELPEIPAPLSIDEACTPASGEYDPTHCVAPPDPAFPSSPEGLDDYRNLYGYNGPYYSPLVSGGTVRVLDQTVYTETSSGTFRAWGLVRNESGTDAGQVTVTATLFDANNVVLGTASGLSPVFRLRPNEPGPFAVTSTVAAPVARVEWTVALVPLVESATRKLAIGEYRRIPYGDRQRVDSFIEPDPTNGPYPFRLSGLVRNHDSQGLQNPTVVGAFMDASGRVRWIETASLADENGGAAAALNAGDWADFVLTVGDGFGGPRANEAANVLLWGTSQ